jgi:hypothetical protein
MHRFALALALFATAAFAGADHPQCHKKDSTAVSDTAKHCHKKKGECPKGKDSTGMDSAQCAKHKAECKKHGEKGE